MMRVPHEHPLARANHPHERRNTNLWHRINTSAIAMFFNPIGSKKVFRIPSTTRYWHSLYAGLYPLALSVHNLVPFSQFAQRLLLVSHAFLLFSCSLASLLKKYAECQSLVRGMPKKRSWNASVFVRGVPAGRTGNAVHKGVASSQVWENVRGMPSMTTMLDVRGMPAS